MFNGENPVSVARGHVFPPSGGMWAAAQLRGGQSSRGGDMAAALTAPPTQGEPQEPLPPPGLGTESGPGGGAHRQPNVRLGE